MKLITFNLNRMATVKLSELGVNCLSNYRHIHGHTHGKFNSVTMVLNIQVWELMEIFGPAIYHGAEMSPFINNEMTIDLDSV